MTSARGHLVVVAGAQPHGTQPDPHFVAWLATRLGQPDPAACGLASAFTQAGWEARIECRPVGASTVILILVEKVPAGRCETGRAIEDELEELSHREDARVLSGRY